MMWPFSSSYPTAKPSDIGVELGDVSRTSAPTFDYIIVGGGTAGCCLTSLLSEDPDVTVLLIKRGSMAETWASRGPLISSDIFKKDSIALPLNSLPQVHADRHVIPLMRDPTLGGISRVNAMFYTRGVPADFNRWRDMGASRLELREDAAVFRQVGKYPQPSCINFSE